MDLLGGYGSEGSDSDSESEHEAAMGSSSQQPKQLPTQHAPARKTADAGTSISTNTNTNTNTGIGIGISKRGKKLVSLHAVLPPHILQQLTNDGNANQSDSDDDDQQEQNHKPHSAKSTNNTQTHNKPLKRGADHGLTSLLTELGSVGKTSANANANPKQGQNFKAKEKMGQAFLQTQTTTTRTKSNEENVNVNVHVHTPVLDIHAQTHVETVQETDDEHCIHTTEVKSTALRRKTPAPPRTRPRLQTQVPRPNMFPGRPITAPPQYDGRSTIEKPPDHHANYSGIDEPQDQAHAAVDDRTTRKRSRKEMERALRSGNMSAVDGHGNVQTFDAQQHVYMPEDSATTAPNQGTGVRVAPVAMYDTKAGKDVLGANVSGKARGKNQINYLMASAAAFEANQAQQAKAKSHRASAKRKYGW